MKILLSPAKALDMTKTLQTDEVSVPFFMDEAQLLMNKLSKLSANKIGELMHLSGDLSKLNFDRNQQWKPSIESDGNFTLFVPDPIVSSDNSIPDAVALISWPPKSKVFPSIYRSLNLFVELPKSYVIFVSGRTCPVTSNGMVELCFDQ